jgi:hypothetical protein
MKCNPKSLGVFFGALLCIALLSSEVSADPLFFSNVRALQNSGLTTVDLNANPNATLFGSQINFLVDISGVLPQNGIDVLSITYTEQGSAPVTQTFQIPLFGSVNPPFSLQFAINPTNPTAPGTPATLTIDLLNSSPDFVIPSGPNAGQQVNSRTYAFNVASPVPEPSTLVLFGPAAVVGLGALRRKLRKS